MARRANVPKGHLPQRRHQGRLRAPRTSGRRKLLRRTATPWSPGRSRVRGAWRQSLIEWLIFEEEYYRAGAPQRVTQNGIFLLAPSIYEFGTPASRSTTCRRMSAAEDLWCQGWSEPNAGSDLAGHHVEELSAMTRRRRLASCTARRRGRTRGAFCTHLFGLFRTDPDSVPTHGLTYLLVPLDAEGVTVRGFDRLDGDEGFAEVFFDGAFVPDGDTDPAAGGVLGEVNGGWGVAMATTSSERGLTLRSPGSVQAATATRDSSSSTASVAARSTIPTSCDDAVARAWIDAEAYALYTLGDVTEA